MPTPQLNPNCRKAMCIPRTNGTHHWVDHQPSCLFYKGQPATQFSGPANAARDLQLARRRVRAVGEGATINGTYKMFPEPALEAFRADLLLIVGEK